MTNAWLGGGTLCLDKQIYRRSPRVVLGEHLQTGKCHFIDFLQAKQKMSCEFPWCWVVWEKAL